MSPKQHAVETPNVPTGPRTAEGKARSSANRVTHGLCSQKHKILAEDRPEFDRHYNELLAELAPQGALEAGLAEAIIIDLWRLSRARSSENELFARQAFKSRDDFFAGAETWEKHAKDLALLSLYSQRIHRVLIRNQADFAALQAKRTAQACPAPSPVNDEAAVETAQPAAPEPHTQFVRSSAPAQPPMAAQAAASGPIAAPPQPPQPHAGLDSGPCKRSEAAAAAEYDRPPACRAATDAEAA